MGMNHYFAMLKPDPEQVWLMGIEGGNTGHCTCVSICCRPLLPFRLASLAGRPQVAPMHLPLLPEPRMRSFPGLLSCIVLALVIAFPAMAQERGDREFRECPECPEMVAVPAGAFTMGSPRSERGRFDAEGPQHQVSVRAFALGKYDVTNAYLVGISQSQNRQLINVDFQDGQVAELVRTHKLRFESSLVDQINSYLFGTIDNMVIRQNVAVLAYDDTGAKAVFD